MRGMIVSVIDQCNIRALAAAALASQIFLYRWYHAKEFAV